jgi:ankyrin repeat protein
MVMTSATGKSVDITVTVSRKESVGHVIQLILQHWCTALSHPEHYGLFSLKDSAYLSSSLSLEATGISSQSRLIFRLLPSAPLPLALLRCDEESVIEYLEACSNYDLVDEAGRNLLHLASERDEGTIIIRYLLKKNVDVNHWDAMGRTPVMISALKGSLKAVRLYVRSGYQFFFLISPFFLFVQPSSLPFSHSFPSHSLFRL